MMNIPFRKLGFARRPDNRTLMPVGVLWLPTWQPAEPKERVLHRRLRTAARHAHLQEARRPWGLRCTALL